MLALLIPLLTACNEPIDSVVIGSNCDCPEDDSGAIADPPSDDTDTEPDTVSPDETGAPEDTGDPPPSPVQIYLLGGQSNMDGYGYVTGLPPSLQISQDDVSIYWSGRPQWSALAPSSYGTLYYGTEYFGPEVTFGRRMADERPDETIALIKYAIGGTDLAVCWNPGAEASDPSMGDCYSGWLSTVRDGLEAMEDEYEVAGMIWMQGESDAYSQDYAAAYADNLRHLIDRVREDVSADEMPFAMGIIDCIDCPYREVVRAAQAEVAAESELVMAVETEDLPQNIDNIHFDGSGMRTLGERLAGALLGDETEPATAQPAFAFSGISYSNYTGDFIVGYVFRNDEWIVLTDLGTLDYGWDGLSRDSTVVIWDVDTESIIARASVPSDSSSPSSIWGGWRFVGIEPVDLPPGEYVIGSQVYSGSADRYVHNAQMSAAEGLSWEEGRHANGAVVQYPTNVSTGEASWFGPNFLFLTL